MTIFKNINIKKSDIAFSVTIGAGLFFLLFLGVSSFAARMTKDTAPAEGGLKGGAFMYWMNEILVPESLPPLKNGKYDIQVKLENPTVKKSRRLVSESGDLVVIGKDGKMGIGTENPTSLIDVKGDDAKILISSVSKYPVLKLLTDSGLGRVWFENEKKTLIFSHNLKRSFRINSLGEVIVFNIQQIKEQNIKDGEIKLTNAVVGNQQCIESEFVTGIDEDGKIKCE